MSAQSQKQKVATQTPVTTPARKQDVEKLIITKEQILSHYPDVFEAIDTFPGPHYTIQLDPSVPLNKQLAPSTSSPERKLQAGN